MRIESNRSSGSEEELAEMEHLRDVARNCGRRYRLAYDDSEEYIARFVESVLYKHETDWSRYCRGDLKDNWLYRCAENSLRDYLRHRKHIQSHESVWTQSEDNECCPISVEFIATDPTPEAELLRAELWHRIITTLNNLKPHQRQLVT